MSAETLLTEARARLVAGDLAGARRRAEEAANVWRDAGDPAEEARCLRLASALARHAGAVDDAVTLTARAVAVAPVADSYRAAGVAAIAASDPASAIAEFEAALAHGPTGGLRAALEQGYGAALLVAGRPGDAVRAYRRAAGALIDAPVPAARSLVDGVSQLQAAGHTDLAEALADDAVALAGDDHEVRAALALLAAGRAADRGDLAGALAGARRARAEALAGRTAPGYVAAAVALAALADAAGDRTAAYGSLAVGWVTLGDLLGAEAARAAFTPPLQALRQRWGADGFAQVKAAYEASVRRAKHST